MRIFFSVGEPSGDLHGANLIRQLQQRTPLQAEGLGGPRMAAAGCHLLRDMSDLAVMGFFPVVAKLPEFWKLKEQIANRLDDLRPDAVVLIDFPGFNWHIARLAKQRGIPVFYYGLPQLWAWASWRVNKVRRYVDHALCKLPFEEEWFNDRGCRATYVGHPYFDELNEQRLDDSFLASQRFRSGRVVTLLPGSRPQEIKYNLPILLKAAAQVRRACPDVRLTIASYNDEQAAMAQALVAAGPAPAEVFVGRTPELIAAAECCLACSGSVSLELLYHAKPAVIVYRVGWLTYQFVRRLINVRYITLVNLLASQDLFLNLPDPNPARARNLNPILNPNLAPAPLRPASRHPATSSATHIASNHECLYPEYPTWHDCSEDVARHAIGWLVDESSRQRVIAKLTTLREQVVAGGASATAAEYIVKALGAPQQMPIQRAA